MANTQTAPAETGAILIHTDQGHLNSVHQRVEQTKAMLTKLLASFDAMQIGPFPDEDFTKVLADDNWLDSLLLTMAKQDKLHQRGRFTVTDTAVLEQLIIPNREAFAQTLAWTQRNLNWTLKEVLPVFKVVEGKLEVSQSALERLTAAAYVYAATPAQKQLWVECQQIAQAFGQWETYRTSTLRGLSLTGEAQVELDRLKNPVAIYLEHRHQVN